MSVLRSSPYFSFISMSSSLTIFICKSLLARISLYLAIIFCSSAYSLLRSSTARFVNCPRRISTIALACSSSSEKRSFRLFLASSWFLELRIIFTTSSMLFTAMINPSRICALFCAFASSNFVLLTTTSCLWSTK